jgi:hypothetical protein
VILETGRLLVLDDVEGPPGEHLCEQIWQLGPAATKVKMEFSTPAAAAKSKFSPAYGAKCPGTAMIASVTGQLPIRMAMLLETVGAPGIGVEEAVRRYDRLSNS